MGFGYVFRNAFLSISTFFILTFSFNAVAAKDNKEKRVSSCRSQLEMIYLGQHGDRHVYFDATTKKGRIFTSARLLRASTEPVLAICLNVERQEGITCQSHTVLNILRHLSANGEYYHRHVLGDVENNFDAALNELIEILFESEEGDIDDDLHLNWEKRLARVIRKLGLQMSPKIFLNRPNRMDDLFESVRAGHGVFLNFSFNRVRRVANNLDNGVAERFYSPGINEEYIHGSAHAVAVVGAFEKNEQRYIVVLDSNTGNYAVWNVDELKNYSSGPYINRSLIYYYVISSS